MAYLEEKDLIQNVKDLRLKVDEMVSAFETVQPSIDEILDLKDQFNTLAEKTITVIKMYETSLAHNDEQYRDLLENCKSQFKQVTSDVESLVSLEVNSTDIKARIEECLELSKHMTQLVEGPVVLMKDRESFVEIKDRLPYKRYHNVTDVLATSGIGTGQMPNSFVVSPTMGISFTEP